MTGTAVSEADRARWDARYRSGSYAGREHPSALVAEWTPRMPPGRVLDVACGAGRNALFLAATGRRVDAIDISPAGLERGRRAAAARGLDVRWLEADLEADPHAVPAGPYDAVVLVRFVSAALLPVLLERLAPGALLLVEQHLATAEDVVGPSSPRFRLAPNALLAQFLAAAGGRDAVLRYREDVVTEPDGRRAALAQLVARRA